MSRHDRKQQERKSNRNQLVMVGAGFVVAALIALLFYVWPSPQSSQTDQANIADEQLSEPTPEPALEEQESDDKIIRISVVGDVMAHGPQLESAYDSASDSYDFKPVFEKVRPYIQEADMAIANLETTLPGPEVGYSGYPLFAAPDSLIDALDYAGFDTIITANNHSLDTGVQGLKRTIEVIDDKGLNPVGTFNEATDERILHKEVEGMTLAILSYTEMVNPVGAQPLTAEQMKPMINLLSEEQILTDMAEVSDEADLILAYVHWGEEYEKQPSQNQRHFAEFLADQGVDVIVGSHPHVIQPVEYLERDGREVIVAYSLGNFVSNQRVESLGESFAPTEDGVILNLDVQRDGASGLVGVYNLDFTPTWVYRYPSVGGGLDYAILPIQSSLDQFDFPDDVTMRMENSFEETMRRLEAKDEDLETDEELETTEENDAVA